LCYWWEGIIKHAVEMGSGATIQVPSFIKIGSAIQKLMGGHTNTHTHTHTQEGDLIHLISILNKESRVKIKLKN
jgi:hypothetical protein